MAEKTYSACPFSGLDCEGCCPRFVHNDDPDVVGFCADVSIALSLELIFDTLQELAGKVKLPKALPAKAEGGEADG